ncbi:MAG: HAMP domain-containing protein [Cytophagales bacterium]|nr:MAG: HAMP domain-containing protein [Cytophagales bacterium]
MKKRRSFIRFNLTINQKIIGGFLAIILVFNLNGVFSFISITENANIIRKSSEIDNPTLEEIQLFRLMVTESKMYITNWVYGHDNDIDRELLKNIQDSQYPVLKDRIYKLMSEWESIAQQQAMDTIFLEFEKVVKKQKKIMNDLVEESDYSNTKLTFAADRSLNNEILPSIRSITLKLDKLFDQRKVVTIADNDALLVSFNWLRNITIGLGAILIVVGLISAFFISRSIIVPIKYINDVFEKLGTGELPDDEHRKFDDDEIGQMADAADRIINSLRATSTFAENIGKGNYQAEYTPLSEKDVLGNALLGMRNNLARVAEEDRRRNWQNEGVAKFGDLLRKHSSYVEELADIVLSNLIKYIKANQGGLFVIEDANGNGNHEAYMRLASCYAWDKKKYLEKKIYQGDGLAGQAWQEASTIYITEIPQDYVMITSGLGEANPNSILIVPLKSNEEVFGVLEIASFNHFEPYEIDFIEKIAESIASSVAALKINQRNKSLLEESNLKNKAMQENYGDTPLTSIATEVTSNVFLEKLLAATTSVIETDKNMNILYANELAFQKLKYNETTLLHQSLDILFDNYSIFEKAQEAIQQGHSWSDFTYLKDKEGNRLRMKISAMPELEGKCIWAINDINDTELGA